uniref:(northern house mosquito) hypothetical protein n=1 Tax=Culex pipiens TaxID=7175 RepID=A0A8D8PCX4_CULPI
MNRKEGGLNSVLISNILEFIMESRIFFRWKEVFFDCFQIYLKLYYFRFRRIVQTGKSKYDKPKKKVRSLSLNKCFQYYNRCFTSNKDIYVMGIWMNVSKSH